MSTEVSVAKENSDSKIKNSGDFFDIRKAHDCFQSALIHEDDINIGYYLLAYKELNKFCSLLGSVFSFVGNEIHSKSDVMNDLRNNCQENHYETLKSMINYEKTSNLLSDKNYVSGCRTLLRLHRGLDFIRTFLKRVAELELDGSTSRVGSDVYYQTLGKYHAWIIRQAAFVAMTFLPKKRNLLISVCGKDFEVDVTEVLPLMLQVADEVYNRTQNLFEINNLLDLP